MTAEIHTRSSSGGLKQQLMLPGYRYPVRGGGLGGGSVPQPDAARQPSLTSASIRQRRRNIRSLDDACIPRLFFWGGGKGGGGHFCPRRKNMQTDATVSRFVPVSPSHLDKMFLHCPTERLPVRAQPVPPVSIVERD